MASIRYVQGDLMGRAERSREALKIREELYRKSPEDPMRMGMLASSIERMAAVRIDEEGDPRAAMADYQKALELCRSLTLREPNAVKWWRGVARVQVAVGQRHQQLGERAEAGKAMHSALEVCDRFARLNPRDTDWAHQTFETRIYLSNIAHPGDREGDLKSQLETLRDFIPNAVAEQARSP